MAGHDLTDTYIPYGRGGAGNMRKSSISITNNAFHHKQLSPPHALTTLPDTNSLLHNTGRKSAIRDAWFKITSQPNTHPLTLTSSPDEHYAASKSEPRRRSTNSSTWSSSTAGGEHRSAWKRWLSLRRRSSDEVVEEVDGKEEELER
jgi:hypothetical protein